MNMSKEFVSLSFMFAVKSHIRLANINHVGFACGQLKLNYMSIVNSQDLTKRDGCRYDLKSPLCSFKLQTSHKNFTLTGFSDFKNSKRPEIYSKTRFILNTLSPQSAKIPGIHPGSELAVRVDFHCRII